jgi:hypothetical protein
MLSFHLKGCTRLAVASDKAYPLLTHGRWFSLSTPASTTTKTGRHDIAEILLKVALKHQKSKSNQTFKCSNTAYHTKAIEFTLCFSVVRIAESLVFRVVFVFSFLILLAIVYLPSFLDLQVLIRPLVSSVFPRLTGSNKPFGIFRLSSTYRF